MGTLERGSHWVPTGVWPWNAVCMKLQLLLVPASCDSSTRSVAVLSVGDICKTFADVSCKELLGSQEQRGLVLNTCFPHISGWNVPGTLALDHIQLCCTPMRSRGLWGVLSACCIAGGWICSCGSPGAWISSLGSYFPPVLEGGKSREHFPSTGKGNNQ